MECSNCGKELPKGGAEYCPSCGVQVSTVTKGMAVVEEAGEKTYELAKTGAGKAKPLAKKAVKLTGEALQKVGTEAKKIGKKLEEKGEK